MESFDEQEDAPSILAVFQVVGGIVLVFVVLLFLAQLGFNYGLMHVFAALGLVAVLWHSHASEKHLQRIDRNIKRCCEILSGAKQTRPADAEKAVEPEVRPARAILRTDAIEDLAVTHRPPPPLPSQLPPAKEPVVSDQEFSRLIDAELSWSQAERRPLR